MKTKIGLLFSLVPMVAMAEPQVHDLLATFKTLLKTVPSYVSLKPYMDGATSVNGNEALSLADKSFPGDPKGFGSIYRGQVKFTVDGHALIAESLAGNPAWTVYAAGSRAQPSAIFFLGDPVTVAAGPSLFAKAGLKLSPIACKIIDGANYDAYYFTPSGKGQVVLNISKSTGSGGMWYQYALYWAGLNVGDLPKDAELGSCPIND